MNKCIKPEIPFSQKECQNVYCEGEKGCEWGCGHCEIESGNEIGTCGTLMSSKHTKSGSAPHMLGPGGLRPNPHYSPPPHSAPHMLGPGGKPPNPHHSAPHMLGGSGSLPPVSSQDDDLAPVHDLTLTKSQNPAQHTSGSKKEASEGSSPDINIPSVIGISVGGIAAVVIISLVGYNLLKKSKKL